MHFFSVNKLVSQTSLQVAVYTGQLDIIVNTLGKYNTGIYRNALKKLYSLSIFSFILFIKPDETDEAKICTTKLVLNALF